MPYILPMSPIYRGRCLGGTLNPIIMKLPAKMPADPIPAIDLPSIRAMEVGAEPDTMLPISKMAIEPMYAHFKLKKV